MKKNRINVYYISQWFSNWGLAGRKQKLCVFLVYVVTATEVISIIIKVIIFIITYKIIVTADLNPNFNIRKTNKTTNNAKLGLVCPAEGKFKRKKALRCK